jgi:hypothetical protein
LPEIDLAERAWIHRLVVVARAGTGRTPSRWLAGGLANRHCFGRFDLPKTAGRRDGDRPTTCRPRPRSQRRIEKAQPPTS